ncbi:hypothetical protein A0J61_07883, partial [Choanephora cucurbitarum]
MHKEKTKKPIKKTKKKSNVEKQANTDSPKTNRSVTSPPLQTKDSEWSPMQQKQIELTQQLDAYVGEFQQKLLRLNFEPSKRELVVLFIMNLHPRWRRMVEPVELSFNTWVEAAAYARLHCARVSAMLGCEKHESSPIFKTAGTRALRDSGYFAPDSSPFKKSKDTASIRHLLRPEEEPVTTKKENEVTETAFIGTVFVDEPYLGLSHIDQHADVLKKKLPVVTEDEGKKQEKASSPTSGIKKETEISSASSATVTATNTNTITTKTTIPSSASSISTSKPVSISSATAVSSLASALASEEATKAKEKRNMSIPHITAVKSSDSLSKSQSVCYRVPSEHSGINLSFLELTVNGKKVRGLLAKMRWGSSAMSLDCVHRLGLSMKETNN